MGGIKVYTCLTKHLELFYNDLCLQHVYGKTFLDKIRRIAFRAYRKKQLTRSEYLALHAMIRDCSIAYIRMLMLCDGELVLDGGM